MYEIKVNLSDEQYNLLSEALFFYSEEKDVGNSIEELEDLIDSNSKKVSIKRKYIRPEADCDI
tara:strand:+ start:12128 stop:12316 length:189 start_codon:yes stop_codon:yes gene_type:complete